MPYFSHKRPKTRGNRFMVLGTEQLHNFSSRCLMPGALHWSSDSAERHNINSLFREIVGVEKFENGRGEIENGVNMSNTFRSDQIYNLWLEGNIYHME